MIDVSMFDKIKHKPEEYNFLVTSFYKKEIAKYFEEKKVPVLLRDGYTEYIKMIYEKNPQNPIQHITQFKVHDVLTDNTVLFDYQEFLSGTRYRWAVVMYIAVIHVMKFLLHHCIMIRLY